MAELEKKLKGVQKKLKAVDDLKAQKAAGKTLEKNQLEKIQTEDALKKEVDALNAQIAKLNK